MILALPAQLSEQLAPLSAAFVLAQSSDPTSSGTAIAQSLTEITASKLIRAAISLLCAYIALQAIRFLTDWASERVPRRFRLAIKQSVPFLKGFVLTLSVVYILQIFIRLNETDLFALTGTIAVALGFAFKDYVSSVLAGIITLFEGPFRVGDRVTIGQTYGEVVDYGLRGVRIQTPDDNIVTIPHNVAWTESLSNSNSGQLEAQVVTTFYLAHQVNPSIAIQILYQAAYSSRYTQLKLPVSVIVREQPWATEFQLKAYPMDARDEFEYQTDLIVRAKQAIAAHGLSYPRVGGLAESIAEDPSKLLESEE